MSLSVSWAPGGTLPRIWLAQPPVSQTPHIRTRGALLQGRGPWACGTLGLPFAQVLGELRSGGGERWGGLSTMQVQASRGPGEAVSNLG